MAWRNVRNVALMATVLAALGGTPETLLATLFPTDEAASYGLGPELAKLRAARERLVRRAALRRALDREVADLAGEIDALRTRRDRTWRTLQLERDETLRLERRLDRLVPRILARAAAVRERREQAARVLTDLASMSREVELDATIRARMLAISPLMLQRLRGAESSLASLGHQPDEAIERHHALVRRAPVLIAERQRLQRQREQMQMQRQALMDRRDHVQEEVATLTDLARSLAGRILAVESAVAARADPLADDPALGVPASGARHAADGHDAVVKGSARVPPLAPVASALQPTLSQVIASVPHGLARLRSAAITARAELPALPPPPAKPINVALKGDLPISLPGASTAALSAATPLDVVFLAPARLRGMDPPLLPLPDKTTSWSRDLDPDAPGFTVPAAPGQAIAAPADGRVVFAGRFRSYGLLLIIEHEGDYHTLLWGFSRLDVTKGQPVRGGQVVGVMGAPAEPPLLLHVELRRNGQPVNPLRWLAASSSKVRG